MAVTVDEELVPIASLEKGDLFIQERSRMDPLKVFEMVGKGSGRMSAIHLASDTTRWFSTRDFVRRVDLDE